MAELKPIERRGSAGYDQPRDTYTTKLSEVELKIVQGLVNRQYETHPLHVTDVAGRFAFCKIMNRYPDLTLVTPARKGAWHVNLDGFGKYATYVLVVQASEEAYISVQSPAPEDCHVIAVVTHRGGTTFEFEGWVYVKGASDWCRWREIDGAAVLKKADLRAASNLRKAFYCGASRVDDVVWNGKDLAEPYLD